MDKSQRAQLLITDDFFVEEIENLRKGCVQTFENSRADDYEIRESAYQKLKFINEIVSHFASIADGQQILEKRWKIL
jgi:hypothetical protein